MAKVILVCGRICCGKTTYAHRLAKERRATVLSVDEVMLAMFGQHCGDMHDTYAARTKQYLLAKAAELIASGRVQVNWRECTKADKLLAAGDTVSARGFGKFQLTEVGGTTRKGRTSIVLKRYV